MGWLYGIPDFVGMYTYYKSLASGVNSAGQPNVPRAAIRKKNAYAMASGAAHNLSGALEAPDNLHAANKFLTAVAASERNKEIEAIKSFCEQTGNQFPSLQKYLNNPQSIEKDLTGFYTELTAALNIARRGTKEYLNELLRIKKNLATTERTLADYKADDYRYRVSGDIESFLHRIMGNYNVIDESKTVKSYATKVQKLVLNILNESGLIGKISSGADFAGIASALLIQIEKEVQQEMDQVILHNADKSMDDVIEDALTQIEKKYLAIAHKQAQITTPIEKAITDISSLEFQRITENAKEILGIKPKIIDNDAEKKLRKNIYAKDRRAKTKNLDLTEIRQAVKSNRKLGRDLMLTEFSISGSANSKHGTVYELVESIFNGTNIKGKGATDIITVTLNWQLQQDNDIINRLMSSISTEITNAVSEQQKASPDEIKDTKDLIVKMNNSIDELIHKTEEQLKDMEDFDLDTVFIFHETLKLYSSAETGRSKISGFEGRNMNLLSYIDTLYSMQGAMNFPISQGNMGFLALNIVGGAVADDLKGPLENYLSMYAGMMMFDDLANMANEAVQKINNLPTTTRKGKIIQIHLYNLNGIYVPASMFLSYISDTMTQADQMAASGMIAKASITTGSVSERYMSWGSGAGYQNSKKETHATGWKLNPGVWSAVAAENAAKTKITITFLAAFKAFISRL